MDFVPIDASTIVFPHKCMHTEFYCYSIRETYKLLADKLKFWNFHSIEKDIVIILNLLSHMQSI
jgi:hypothetical protein